jgi:hypothetical protein
MRHFISSIAVLLFMATISPVLYGQDLGYQPLTSSWVERFKEAFFPGFQQSDEGIPGTSLVASTPLRNVFEDGFATAQEDMSGNLEKPVGNIFNLRF